MRTRTVQWLWFLAITAGAGGSWWVWSARLTGGAAAILEYPSVGPGKTLALVITGDELRPSASAEDLGRRLARGGMPTVAIAVASADATPSTVAGRVDVLLRDHLARWHRARVVVVGYRDGAGMAPFVANRIGPDLRGRIDLLVLAGLEPRVSFRRPVRNWLERLPRPTDLPVIPELEKLRGIPVTCVDVERPGREAFCSSLGQGIVRRRVRVARQTIDHGGKDVAQSVLGFLP